jgi:DNA-binding NarL/FixJ family response regulator
MASILIADDHPVVRRGLRSLLETGNRWQVVAEAANGREAIEAVRELHPDVAVLDVGMPQLNGLDACRFITKTLPQTRVLILTLDRNNDFMYRALKAGARGYVLKSDADRDLVAAVEAILRDRTFFRSTQHISSETVWTTSRQMDHTGGDEGGTTLSIRETEIVQLIAEGRSNKEIGVILGISTRTVENHRARIMQKLGLDSMSALIRYAIRNNLLEK